MVTAIVTPTSETKYCSENKFLAQTDLDVP